MNIVADENIPYVRQAFGSLGEVATLPGRKIDAAAVREAEILLVRSITEVNASLLEGSVVRFVGTATIGTDHVDEEYLRSQAIALARAPGSNANSVAEYVVAALLVLGKRNNFRLKGRTVGVIGVGNCGSRVLKKADAMGMKVLLNDPPLYRQTGDAKYRPLEELFDAEVLALHVPLTHEGVDATYHLVDESFLSRLRRECLLINTSRGAVVDNPALLTALESGRLGGAVLDVWENEPNIDLDLLDRVDLGTSHIAGYSHDGKVNATAMLYEAACEFLGVERSLNVESFSPKSHCPRIEVRRQGELASRQPQPSAGEDVRGVSAADNNDETIGEIVRQVYDIERDDAALRKVQEVPPSGRGAFFDRLRKDYPVRREFYNTEVCLSETMSHLAGVLIGLGFRVKVSGDEEKSDACRRRT